MDIQKTFLSLTDKTYGYGDEHLLKDRLPKELQEDELGNYFMEIGPTETMFCCHLDTAAWEMHDVVHDIFKTKKGDTGIGTDGATILGADDKAGVVLLMKLIEEKVPGLYYFFIGEEVGAKGSSGIVRKTPTKFEKYKRCIAFDRRDYGSIITKQRGKVCCSDEFADALIKEFANTKMKFHKDPSGIFTDSASFVNVIPECTNLSVGYFNEHTPAEVINMTYLINLSEAIVKVNWESLPAVREIKMKDTPTPKREPKKENDLTDDDLEEIFLGIDDIMEDGFHMYCYNFDNFVPTKEMVYVDYYDEDKRLSVFIYDNGSLSIGKDKFENFYEFEQKLKIYYDYDPVTHKFYGGEEDDEEENEEENDKYIHTNTYKEPRGNTNGKTQKYSGSDVHTNDDVNDIYSLGQNFTRGLNIQDFLFDVIGFVYENGKNYITVKEMDKLLKSRKKTLEGLIMWLYMKNNDPDKTYGLTWNDTKNRFDVDEGVIQ